jgi:hypothetical protein
MINDSYNDVGSHIWRTKAESPTGSTYILGSSGTCRDENLLAVGAFPFVFDLRSKGHLIHRCVASGDLKWFGL